VLLQALNGGIWSVALWDELPIPSRRVIASSTIIRIVDHLVEASFAAAWFAAVVLIDRVQGIRAIGRGQRLLEGDRAGGGDGVGRFKDTLAPKLGTALARGIARAFHLDIVSCAVRLESGH
jgi:tryptophanase